MLPSALDFWFDFASTYSYPAACRIGALAKAAGVAVRFRPFQLGPIFKAQGWDNSPFNIYEAKGRYMWRDLERLCADLQIPFARPQAFPQHSLLAARIATAGEGESWYEDFCRAVFRAQFGDGKLISEREVLSGLLAALKVDPAPVLERAQSDEVKAKLRAQGEEAQRIGLFGAPSFITADGELFWGNDRLEAALAWAQTHP